MPHERAPLRTPCHLAATDMTRLALGTVQFGLDYGIANQAGQVAPAQVSAMLSLAASRGIDTLDTAVAYGNSEARLGAAGVADFRVVTKLPAVPEHVTNVAAWVTSELAASLARLGCSRLHGLLLHQPRQLLGPRGQQLYAALRAVQAAHQVEKIGVSVYRPSELAALTEQFDFEIVQLPLNVIDQRFATSGWLSRLASTEVEVHTRSAFLQGLLLMQCDTIPAKFAPWSDLLRTWRHWLVDNQVSAVQACLAFSLSHPEIGRVVVGAESVCQLEEIIAAAEMRVPLNFPGIATDADKLINPANW